MTGRADIRARSVISMSAALEWASLDIVRKLSRHHAKGLDRLTSMSTFSPSSYIGTAAMWRAANDNAQTGFDVCDVHMSTLKGIHKDISEVY